MAYRTAATLPVRTDQPHAQTVEHARGDGVGSRRGGRLRAAFQHQHRPRVGALRSRRHLLLRRHLLPQRRGQQWAHALTKAQQHAEETRMRQHLAQRVTQQPLAPRSRHLPIEDLAPDVGEPAVLHARRAGGLAGAAGQAAVEVQLRAAPGRLAFEHLLELVDASARAVEFVAEQLVGRTGRGAEPAMHASAQNGVGLLAFGCFQELLGQMRLHKLIAPNRGGRDSECRLDRAPP